MICWLSKNSTHLITIMCAWICTNNQIISTIFHSLFDLKDPLCLCIHSYVITQDNSGCLILHSLPSPSYFSEQSLLKYGCLAWLYKLWYSPLGKYSLFCFILACIVLCAMWCVSHYVSSPSKLIVGCYSCSSI